MPMDQSASPPVVCAVPAFLAPNLWPSASLPHLRPAFRALGGKIVEVGTLVARACDGYVADALSGRGLSSRFTSLEYTVRSSRVPKGRLLWYFPADDPRSRPSEAASDATSNEDGWCGWHNDHGSLTGLCSAMFLNQHGEVVQNPDPSAGLLARARDGTVHHVTLPPNCMGFQIGETAQVHSGGLLQATPHAVKASPQPGVGRAQLAVFMEPEWDWKMQQPVGVSSDVVLRDAAGRVLPPGVPSLSNGRWVPEDDFGSFSEKTLKEYYS
jgi:isopenicillin N synthase-like dioxygenase